MFVSDGRSKVKQSVILTNELRDAISRGAGARDVSCSQIVREALRVGLKAMGLLTLPSQADCGPTTSRATKKARQSA